MYHVSSFDLAPDESSEVAGLRKELDRYKEQFAGLMSRFETLIKEIRKTKIETFEELATQDEERMRALIALANQTTPIELKGKNIGLFGQTSTGKSTMLNALLKKEVAATGPGETTQEITPYNHEKFTLWDVPGRNDEVSYFSMEYISFFKGLTHRLILIQSTVKENSSMMKLLDAIELDYDIVFNKFDLVKEKDRETLQEQIKSEVKRLGLKRVKNLFFVSSENPSMFSDWQMMTTYITSVQH